MISINVGVVRCTYRSARVNRSIRRRTRPASAGRDIAGPAVRLPDPAVHVIAVALPIAGLDRVHHLDLREPLDALVPVHRHRVDALLTPLYVSNRPPVHP